MIGGQLTDLRLKDLSDLFGKSDRMNESKRWKPKLVLGIIKGQVSEWFKEVVLKTTDGASYPGVRIPPCPFHFYSSRQAGAFLDQMFRRIGFGG